MKIPLLFLCIICLKLPAQTPNQTLRTLDWLQGSWKNEYDPAQVFVWNRLQDGSLEGVLNYQNSKMQERWLLIERKGQLTCMYTPPKSTVQNSYLGRKRAGGIYFQADPARQPGIIALEKDGIRKMKLIFSDLKPGTDREVTRRFIKMESRRWEFN